MTRNAEKLANGLRLLGEGLALVASALSEAASAGVSLGATSGATPDDAIIDQDSKLVPRDLYLRLAREKAFPSKKHGKRVAAQWRDVRLAAVGTEAEPIAGSDEEETLDAVRRRVGLCPRKGT